MMGQCKRPTCKEVKSSTITKSISVGVHGPEVSFIFASSFSSDLVRFVTDGLIYNRLSVMCLNYGEEKYSF